MQNQQIDTFHDLNMGFFKLPMITVYESPMDFPGQYVARLWDVDSGMVTRTQYIVVKETLEGLRRTIPNQLFRFERNAEDDPVILETWL